MRLLPTLKSYTHIFIYFFIHSADFGETFIEKTTSKFSLPRLGSNSLRKSSSGQRPSTPTGFTSSSTTATTTSPNKPGKEFVDLSPKQDRVKKERDSTVLRKRTISSPTSANGGGDGGDVQSPAESTSGLVKPGQSILEQIGEPDHVGWMRKRGDRYNSWRNRYFVLKGPHMYCMRSDSKSVSPS